MIIQTFKQKQKGVLMLSLKLLAANKDSIVITIESLLQMVNRKY